MTKRGHIDPYKLIENKADLKLLYALMEIKDKKSRKEIILEVGRQIERTDNAGITIAPMYPKLSYYDTNFRVMFKIKFITNLLF